MSEAFHGWVDGLKTAYKTTVKIKNNAAAQTMQASIEQRNGKEMLVGKFDLDKEKGEIYDRRIEPMVVPVDRRGWDLDDAGPKLEV